VPADGSPVNRPDPLGVPSRMNVGQVLETHRVAAACWGSKRRPGVRRPASARSSSCSRSVPRPMSASSRVNETANGLFDGGPARSSRSPSRFGQIYMMKLLHWWRTRSTRGRPAVLPDHPAAAGRKAQFGGQRFGEMEVWPSRRTARPTPSRSC